MQKYNFSANVVRTIEQLYYEASSAVQMNGSMKERLKKGPNKARMFSVTTPFNIFLGRIMSDALEKNIMERLAWATEKLPICGLPMT